MARPRDSAVHFGRTKAITSSIAPISELTVRDDASTIFSVTLLLPGHSVSQSKNLLFAMRIRWRHQFHTIDIVCLVIFSYFENDSFIQIFLYLLIDIKNLRGGFRNSMNDILFLISRILIFTINLNLYLVYTKVNCAVKRAWESPCELLDFLVRAWSGKISISTAHTRDCAHCRINRERQTRSRSRASGKILFCHCTFAAICKR